MDSFSFAHSRVAGRLPAQDLERARRFYADALGLEPVEEREGGLLYRVWSGEFALFASQGAPSGTHTQMAFDVDDVEAAYETLRGRGVEIDPAGLVDVEGNYPSKGTGERGFWFRDSEGNVLGVGQTVR